MAQNTKWYVDSVGWTAVTAWSTPQTPAAGTIQRQLAAPTVGNERVFAVIVSGAVGGAEPAWVLTKGAKTTDNAATWIEVTGQPGVNGDTTNSSTWLTNKNAAVAQGLVIFDSVSSSLQVCTTAGNSGNGAQPAFSATAGTTTADNTVTWTSLGLASTFGGWAAPHARLANSWGTNWAAAGDTIFVASEHAETQSAANTTLNPPGTLVSPNQVISVNKLAVPPTSANVAAGGSVATTGNNQINSGNSVTYTGMTFSAPSSSMSFATNGSERQNYVNCTISVGNTLLNPANGTGGRTVFSGGTSVTFAGTSGVITITNGSFEWDGGSLGGTAPTKLFNLSNGANNEITVLRGLDLSVAGAGKTLFQTNGGEGNFLLADSKIAAAVTLNDGFNTSGINAQMTLINVDSGATGFKNQWSNYTGDVTTETTITLKNGASDGVQSVSHKYVTTANVSPTTPLVWPSPNTPARFGVWNTTTGKSVTATVQIISSGTLNNNDIWLEIEFLGSAASPVSSFSNNGLANPLSTVAAQTSSTATWNSQPATPVTQQLQVSFTPQLVGYVYGKIYVGKASATVWVDPEITIK